jgi:hypothetical protein
LLSEWSVGEIEARQLDFQNVNVDLHESLRQLHSIGKRSCSCEAIPRYNHAREHFELLIG